MTPAGGPWLKAALFCDHAESPFDEREILSVLPKQD